MEKFILLIIFLTKKYYFSHLFPWLYVDQKIDKCLSEHNRVSKVIRNLHNQKIKNFTIVIYRLCSGVKGWSDKEQTKMWKAHKKLGNLDLKIKDKNGTT